MQFAMSILSALRCEPFSLSLSLSPLSFLSLRGDAIACYNLLTYNSFGQFKCSALCASRPLFALLTDLCYLLI